VLKLLKVAKLLLTKCKTRSNKYDTDGGRPLDQHDTINHFLQVFSVRPALKNESKINRNNCWFFYDKPSPYDN